MGLFDKPVFRFSSSICKHTARQTSIIAAGFQASSRTDFEKSLYFFAVQHFATGILDRVSDIAFVTKKDFAKILNESFQDLQKSLADFSPKDRDAVIGVLGFFANKLHNMFFQSNFTFEEK